jgi:hypothetical protein
VAERWDLRRDGELAVSEVSLAACLRCADDHGIRWEAAMASEPDILATSV